MTAPSTTDIWNGVFVFENEKISPKWSGLSKSLLVDIYGVHKALQFGQLQRTDYSHSEFLKNVTMADSDIFKENICTDFVSENETAFTLSFYPFYLVNDDLFEVMSCHFATSLVVNRMVKNVKLTNGLHIRSVVIPAAICSRYDGDDVYYPTISDVGRYNQSASSSELYISPHVEMNLDSVATTADTISKLIAFLDPQSASNIIIVFNRQQQNDENPKSITVFQCSDFSKLSKLNRNYFVSFDFHITYNVDAPNPLVRCWLMFGLGQRLRFYPEYAVWIIPNLFVRSPTMSTYKVVQTLYSEKYKHGWRVALDDEVFNKYYHIITGYEHVSNNYNRMTVEEQPKHDRDDECGLRDHLNRILTEKWSGILNVYVIEQAYDSDTILQDMFNEDQRIDGGDSNIAKQVTTSANLRELKFAILRFENMECTTESMQHIDDCHYIEMVIQNLQKFQEYDLEIDALSVIHFNLDSIINGFDHLIKVHKFLSDQVQNSKIQNYIAQRIQCDRGVGCEILSKHSNRTRERGNDELRRDEPLHEVDTLCEAVSGALHSVHCYLLHRNDHLYRLLSDRNDKFQSRFATESAKEDEMAKDDRKEDAEETHVPLGINFGLNVLKWLPYEVYPVHQTLKDEIIRNPESTIDRELFNHYEMICIAKIKNTNYTLKEMLGLKLYTDTTDLQAKLRRAHWTVASLAIRRAYYQWAMGLYETFLYHAVPIEKESGKSSPCKLYHGLSRMFMMTHELPVYNGPFSTTIAKSVATTFCNEQGLIWMIQSTFANPLRFCVGISVEWISGFKHEREVLLYNQFLPIQKTETFDDDIDVLVDHFLFSLRARAAPISKEATFYNQLGIHFSPDWIPRILQHSVLHHESQHAGMTVFQRHRRELNIQFFSVWECVDHALTDERDEFVVLPTVEEYEDLETSEYIFMIRTGSDDETEAKEFHFEKVSDFRIPCGSVSGNPGINPIHIFIKPSDNSFECIRIKSMLKKEYVLATETPLRISESFMIPPMDRKGGQRGTLSIRCSSDIVIRQNIIIEGSEPSDSTKNAPGPAIVITSKGTFCNRGTVCCNGVGDGKGGDMYITTNSFENESKMECTPNGNIVVVCTTFVDTGCINPVPTVVMKPPGVDDFQWSIIMMAVAANEKVDAMSDVRPNSEQVSDALTRSARSGRFEEIKIIHECISAVLSQKEVHEVMNGKYSVDGCTPLHLACKEGHENIAKYLVETIKVDISRRDDKNKTATDYAKQNGHQHIADWLFSRKFYSTCGERISWKKVGDFSALLPRDVKQKLWNGVFKTQSDYEAPEVQRISKVLRTFTMLQLTRVLLSIVHHLCTQFSVSIYEGVQEDERIRPQRFKESVTRSDEGTFEVHLGFLET